MGWEVDRVRPRENSGIELRRRQLPGVAVRWGKECNSGEARGQGGMLYDVR